MRVWICELKCRIIKLFKKKKKLLVFLNFCVKKEYNIILGVSNGLLRMDFDQIYIWVIWDEYFMKSLILC